MSLPGMQFTLQQEAVDMEGIGLVTWIILLAIILVQIAAWWKMFEKAGKPGWWIILCLIPIVNIIVMLLVSIGVANNFGKGTLFGIGLFLLGFIFYPILGFGDDQYGAAPA